MADDTNTNTNTAKFPGALFSFYGTANPDVMSGNAKAPSIRPGSSATVAGGDGVGGSEVVEEMGGGGGGAEGKNWGVEGGGIDHHLTPEEMEGLADGAVEAMGNAYCPYSHFRVGASLLLSTGEYFTGANVENAAYPVGTCAERCALATAVASMPRPAMPKVRALAVATDISPPASPCGMCRQFIREFCLDSMPIYMYCAKEYLEAKKPKSKQHNHAGKGGAAAAAAPGAAAAVSVCVVRTLGELLPMSFGPDDLKG